MRQLQRFKIFLSPKIGTWVVSTIVLVNILVGIWLCESYYRRTQYLNAERIIVQLYTINTMFKTVDLTDKNISTLRKFFTRLNKLKNVSLSMTEKPQHKSQITNASCQLFTFYSGSIDKDCQPLLNALPKYQATGQVSYYIAPLKKWLNITISNPRLPYAELLSLSLETVLLLIFVFYVFSIHSLTQAWERMEIAAKKLGVRLPSEKMPKYGPIVIRSAAMAMDSTLQRLDQLVKERLTIMASLSHDIRTPLTKVQLYTEKCPDKMLQQKILPQVELINTLLGETLSYAREDYFTEKKQFLDLVSLIEVICEEMIDTGRNVTFKKDIAYFKVQAQPIGLQRAISNLINNALFYGDKADVVLTGTNNSVQVVITDNGSGIPETELQKVFEPFYRFESSRSKKTGGTGLGLAIAKSIIEFNKGQISLANLAGNKGLQVSLIWFE